MADIKFPYNRPESLSDPFNDNLPQSLAKLLEKQDADLDWNDLRLILGPFLPAGNYEESAYFFPLAFNRAIKHDDEAFDLQASLIWFASEYWQNIQNDGVGDATRSHLVQCLDHWTRTFNVVHYDDEQCREKGWGRKYLDLVWMSENVIEYLNDLIRFESHADLAFSFFNGLAQPSGDPLRSAWFLELARSHVGRDVYRLQNRQMQSVLDDESLGIEHSNTVQNHLDSFGDAPTYWRDTFNLLSLPLEHIDE